jgi:hypothetical protein
MIPAALFSRRGPDEPIRPRGLCQSAPAYVAGREDWLFQRPERRFIRAEEQYTYDCAQAHERNEQEAVRHALIAEAVRLGIRCDRSH